MSQNRELVPIPENIFNGVQSVLIDALAVDDDEVVLDANFTNDLGAESIDFLDIVFRLEKQFDMKIDRFSIFVSNSVLEEFCEKETGWGNVDFIDHLIETHPYLDIGSYKEDILRSRNGDDALEILQKTHTVEAICRYIMINGG